MRKVAVTGASGFIGQALVARATELGAHTVSITRAAPTESRSPGETHVVVDQTDRYALSRAMRGAEVVFHLAARTHQRDLGRGGALEAYRMANVQVTRAALLAAASAGVRRFVLMSSIKVNGERTANQPFRADDPPAPEDHYGVTKLEAEIEARTIGARAGFEVVVMRSPLVYGAGVKGNLARLMSLVGRGVPLPVGDCSNRRSLIGRTNLVDALLFAAHDDATAGRTFLIADSCVSSRELVTAIAHALGREPRMLAVPERLLRWIARPLGMAGEMDRLVGSLEIDPASSLQAIGWRPRIEFHTEIQAMCSSYLLAEGS